MPYLSMAIRFQALFASCHRFFSTFHRCTDFAIGFKEYLELEVDASQIPVQYPVNSTQELAQTLLSYLYVTITL